MSKRAKAYRSTLPYYNTGGAPYALLDCLTISEADIQCLRTATNAMNRIFDKMARVLQEAPDEVLFKPSFGREGDTVRIYNADGTLDVEDGHRNYESFLPVYQQYCPLPVQRVKTPSGKKEAYTLFGVFSIGGEASAVGVRAASTQITGNVSWFVPIGC